MLFEIGYSIWMVNMPFFIFVETKGFLCLYQSREKIYPFELRLVFELYNSNSNTG